MTTEDGKFKSFLSSWGLPARPCDSCRTTAALIFCRIDSVFLCISCDTRIHKLASGHERVWMCEVCEQAPASVTCKADVASLCVKCDRDIHSANPLSRRHERFPVVPFSDSAAEGAIAKSAMSGTAAAACDDGGDVDTWLIPNPSGRLSVEFLLSDADPFSEFGHDSKNSEMKGEEPNRVFSTNNMTDSVVPNQSKSRSMNFPFNENCYDIDFTRSKVSTFSYSNQCVSSSDAGVVPDRGNSSSISETSDFSKSMSTRSNVTDGSSVGSAAVPLSRVDREARVLRYREKRKNRKFEKTIRYASRKAYAETRPRIKGRFAKRTKTEMMMDGGSKVHQIIFGSNNGSNDASLFDHGVVPSFCL